MPRLPLAAIRAKRGTLPDRELARRFGLSKKELSRAYALLDQKSTPAEKGGDLSHWARLGELLRRFLGALIQAPFRASVIIFGVALALRIVFLVLLWDSPLLTIPILDAAVYREWGQAITAGTPPSEAFFTEPGYAYLLAALFALFGDTLVPVILLQIALGSLTPVFLFLATRRLFNTPRAALASGFIAALFGENIFYESVLLKTSVETFLLAAFLVVFSVARTENRRRNGLFFALGIIAGLTALVKANILYALPLFAVGVWFGADHSIRRSLILPLALLVLGALLPIAPATIHNYRSDGSIALVNTSGGANLYIGNWDGADGSLKPPEHISVDPRHEGESWQVAAKALTGEPLSRSAASSFFTAQALSEIVSHPGDFVAGLFHKGFLALNSHSLGDNYDLAFIRKQAPFLSFLFPFAGIVALGIVGAVILLTDRHRRNAALPLLALFGGYLGTILISHVTDRYRITLVPLLLVFATTLFARIAGWYRDQRTAPLIATGIALLAVALLSFLPPRGISRTTPADILVNLGAEVETTGAIDRARSFYEDALAENGRHVPSLARLARLELSAGNIDRAIALYRATLTAQPEHPADELLLALDAKERHDDSTVIRARLDQLETKREESHFIDADGIEGLSALRIRDFQTAARRYEAVRERHPDDPGTLVNLATAYKNTGRANEARELFAQALTHDPSLLSARFNYANLLSENLTLLPAAIREYEAIERIAPNFAFTRYYLGLSLAQSGDLNRAIELLRQFIDASDPTDPLRADVLVKARADLERMVSAQTKTPSFTGAR